MRFLLNSQKGLNNKRLGPEEREIANKLNSTILHIAGKYPDGKIPAAVEAGLKERIKVSVMKQSVMKMT